MVGDIFKVKQHLDGQAITGVASFPAGLEPILLCNTAVDSPLSFSPRFSAFSGAATQTDEKILVWGK